MAKRKRSQFLCFRSFHTAEKMLEGVEAPHMMRKGQVKRLGGRDAVGQAASGSFLITAIEITEQVDGDEFLVGEQRLSVLTQALKTGRRKSTICFTDGQIQTDWLIFHRKKILLNLLACLSFLLLTRIIVKSRHLTTAWSQRARARGSCRALDRTAQPEQEVLHGMGRTIADARTGCST